MFYLESHIMHHGHIPILNLLPHPSNHHWPLNPQQQSEAWSYLCFHSEFPEEPGGSKSSKLWTFNIKSGPIKGCVPGYQLWVADSGLLASGIDPLVSSACWSPSSHVQAVGSSININSPSPGWWAYLLIYYLHIYPGPGWEIIRLHAIYNCLTNKIKRLLKQDRNDQ